MDVDSLVHSVRLHGSKPDLEMRAEVLSVELQHGDVSSTVHLQQRHRQVSVRVPGPGPGHVQNARTRLQPQDNREGRDRRWDAGQALVEGELHRLHPDDGPAGTIVQHHPAGVSGAAGRLEEGRVEVKDGDGDGGGARLRRGLTWYCTTLSLDRHR